MLNSNSRFSKVPQLDIQRSTWDMNFCHKATFNAGKLIPFCAFEVLPGDTFSWDTAQVIRMRTPLNPTMDNLFYDYFYFYVPNRIIFDNWKYFLGESEDAWTSDVTYTLPTISMLGNPGGVRDHFGLPSNPIRTYECSALPLRAYRMIWNEWFRDQNLQDPKLLNKGSIENDYTLDDLLPVNKLHDYFTSCLPAPIKASNPIYVPLGERAPVLTSQFSTPYSNVPMTFGPMAAGVTANMVAKGSSNGVAEGKLDFSGSSGAALSDMVPSNLWADLTQAEGATINSLRLAFATQRLLERDARGGTRYRENIYSHFGVSVPDASAQVPEYLCGERVPINITTVLQTSGTNPETESPLGYTGAYSHTTRSKHDFSKSFTEHGWIIGVMCVRNMNSYFQGIPKSWSRKTRFDYYWPEFANLGEQPVYNREIYHSGDSFDNQVFGYQEAWAEYRYIPSTVSGEFRTTMRDWHYSEDFSALPTLSDGFIQSNPELINRTLAVSDSVADQFYIDMAFNVKATRPMPLYSVPGLIDHH